MISRDKYIRFGTIFFRGGAIVWAILSPIYLGWPRSRIDLFGWAFAFGSFLFLWLVAPMLHRSAVRSSRWFSN